METQDKITHFLERLAEIAHATQQKITWFVIIALIASTSLAWRAYSMESELWWNITKCGLILLPSLIWGFLWTVLGQLEEAPELAAKLASRDDGLVSQFAGTTLDQQTGVSGLFNTLKAFKQEKGPWIVLDTIGNVSLLANPVFVALCFIMAAVIFLFIVVSVLLLIF